MSAPPTPPNLLCASPGIGLIRDSKTASTSSFGLTGAHYASIGQLLFLRKRNCIKAFGKQWHDKGILVFFLLTVHKDLGYTAEQFTKALGACFAKVPTGKNLHLFCEHTVCAACRALSPNKMDFKYFCEHVSFTF